MLPTLVREQTTGGEIAPVASRVIARERFIGELPRATRIERPATRLAVLVDLMAVHRAEQMEAAMTPRVEAHVSHSKRCAVKRVVDTARQQPMGHHLWR